MKPSANLHSSPGFLLGGWYEIADDLRAVAAVMLVADGHCHCAHVSGGFCSCCTSSNAHLHDVCDACDRLLKRLDAAVAALEDHTLRFTPALADLTRADELTRSRFTRLCTLAAQVRRLLFAVEMRKASTSAARCATADLIRLVPVSKELDTLARALADTVPAEHRPWTSA